MNSFGIITLLPAALVLVVAIITKRTTESLLVGCLVSYIIIGGKNFIPIMNDAFFEVVSNSDNQWLLLVCGLFGSLIVLLNASKGTHAIARALLKICKNEKSTLLVSWLLGIIIFIDDYMNILTISACMKKISDKNKIPRESLAYVIDSTGAPVCVLLPFSTWAIFYANTFWEQESVHALNYGSAMSTYKHVIPYMFYAIVAVLIIPLYSLGVVPKFGPMKRAYERVKLTGNTYSDISKKLNLDVDDDDVNSNILDFLIPIGLLIIVTLVSDDVFISVIVAILSCLILYVPRRKMTISKFCDLWIRGFADTIPALSILLAALFMRKASADLNLPEYVIGLVQPYISAKTFPMITFLVVSLLAFVTGSNWGIPGVCVPIIIPLATVSGANLLLVMAAVVSGGVFSSHACFYSDATVITSSSCGIQNMEHATSQFPYALLSMVISSILFLVFGMVM